MARPQTQSWKVAKSKAEAFIANKQHFSWELVTSIPTAGKDGVLTITMKREKAKGLNKIRKMEKQHKSFERKFPVAALIGFILGGGAIVAYFVLTQYIWRIALLIFGVIAVGCALFNLIIFLVGAANSKTFKKILEDDSDELGGRHKDTKFAGNLKEAKENTGLLKQNLVTILEKKEK